MSQIRYITARELLYFDTCRMAVWKEVGSYAYDHEGD